jgi:hypothetical protein
MGIVQEEGMLAGMTIPLNFMTLVVDAILYNIC